MNSFYVPGTMLGSGHKATHIRTQVPVLLVPPFSEGGKAMNKIPVCVRSWVAI